MSYNLPGKTIVLAAIVLVLLTDGAVNLFVGTGSANKTLALPSVPEVFVANKAASSSYDPDVVDGLFGLKAVVLARENARAQRAAQEREAELANIRPEEPEQVLVIGEDQFRLFGVSSNGMQQYAIFSIDNPNEDRDLLELAIGETIELLNGLALLSLERVGVQSVSLRINYIESKEQVLLDLGLFESGK